MIETVIFIGIAVLVYVVWFEKTESHFVQAQPIDCVDVVSEAIKESEDESRKSS